ncbi:MAG TPA: helix-turn-helix transcriptional regulator [Candidatus Limiplasma sp.]|nr:helix-turn-helix transcriptional regulator [Candidatus Limiplasma sp.]HRX09275.1 helix-turn-helix transcriptional regulator [Candidatus Limiplasma sp.]
MDKHLTITNTIRTLRFFAGEMSQQLLAEKAGVSRQTILAVEAGKYSPSLELAFRIALVFGVPIGEVFSCEECERAAANKPGTQQEGHA